MRGASIPAWTFLREPSASSGAPSEDELLGHSSQEVVDELVRPPPLQSATSSRRMGPPPVPGPSSARNHGGGRQSGNYGTQPSSSASRRPTSPSRTRRPHSGTDEDDERPKKRKRDLLNPDKDGPHQSQTVQLSDSQRYTKGTHQRLLFNAPLSNATASRSGQHRRATVAGPFESKNAQPNAGPLNHKGVDKQGRAGGSASSVGRHPAPLSQAQTRNARPSTQVASAKGSVAGASQASHRPPRARPGASRSSTQPTNSQRRKSAISLDDVVDLTEEAPETPASSRAHRRASGPAIPPPPEVIEILDSDEEPLPPPPASKTPQRAIKPEPNTSSSSGSSPPPRNRNQRLSKPVAPPAYREDTDGAIILDSSDDDDPPARTLAPQKNSARTAQQKGPSPGQRKASSLARSSPPAQYKSSPPESPVLWSKAQALDVRMSSSSVPPPEPRASLVAKPPPLEDVNMTEDAADSFDAGDVLEPVEFEMEVVESQATSEEVPRSNPEAIQELEPAAAPVVDSAVDVAGPEARNPVDSGDAFVLEPAAECLAGAPSVETVLRNGSLILDNASPHMHSIPQTSRPPEAAQPPPPNILSTASSSTRFASLRAETASPVSAVLDPLQGLVITESTPESTDLARSAATISSPSGNTISSSGSPKAASRKRSLKPTDRSPWKMHGAAHGGPTGWFNHNRLSQKRRSGLQNRHSKSPVPQSSMAASSASSPPVSTAVGGSSPRELLPESPNAATPMAEARAAPLDDALAQGKVSLSPVPLQPPQDSDKSILDSPVLQGVGSDEEPRVQSDILQQRPIQSSMPPVVEGQAPSEATVTEMRESRGADSRSETPPADDPLPAPLGPTLSQIIRNAANENARRNMIDLTLDKSDDDRGAVSPHRLPDKPVSQLRMDSPPWSPSAPPARPLPASTPLTLQQSSPVKAPVRPLPPLPRLGSFRRRSDPDALESLPTVRTTRSSATASVGAVQDPGTSQVPVQDNVPTSVPIITPASSASTKPRLVLPRRPQVMRNVQATRSSASGSLEASRVLSAPLAPAAPATAPPEDGMIVDDSGPSTSADVPPLPLAMPSTSGLDSPPHSDSPVTNATDEEECRSLIYPSTTPEESPEVEIPDEDEFPIRSHAGRRTQSQASSEASYGPRRSARLSSSSASSSVEPEDFPRPRLRRRERVTIRTPSDDEIASQGGISRFRTRYSRAFEAAGFESLSWKKDQRRVAKEFAPVTQSADNIPHDLHDRLNALPPSARHASNLQAIFEAEIAANTAEDEPNAPPIRVINDVDDEPTPPMEFYYSNLMWHSTDVPRPDFDALKGCGCIGACNPMSRTCACVRRQKEHCDGLGGFLYDQKGRLKTHEYPIFECNINCGCSDDCPNRVMQRGRQYEIAIRKTASKGWGVFAGPKRIPGMSFLGVYAGEYLTDEEGEKRGLHYNSFGRTYLFDLDFYHIKKDEDDPPKYTVDAYHAGNFTRYLNHSCDPNCAIVPGYINESNIDKPLLTMFTLRDVEPYEELCFDYNGSDDEKLEDRGKDGAVYVTCQCGTVKCKGFVWK